ncbi:sulfotransferase family protein [Marinobacter sp. F4216]|uniref:sulfotransferase family protein n=1 Tax=Marinobacter sp. F4216 TaxID=2874281 RepID=UPI001CBACDD7|nr:sulfotransferase [Marinobacter sp. F4216]MBZ2167688.1 sulfotransferase [Marinobacter sp. F4216]
MMTKKSHKNTPAPVFLMGTQRSGTTLLARALSAHPEIFVKNEIELPYVFGHSYDKQELINAIENLVLEETTTSVNELFAQGKVKLWALKDPQLTDHIDELRPFIQDTLFVVIVRDGRGVTNSYIENKWGLGTNAYTGAQRWKREVEQQEAFIKTAPDRFLYIRYEDLVDDLKSTMERVCSHLGVEFHPNILEYDKKSAHIHKKRENIHTHDKPDPRLAEKWRGKLTPFEIGVIEMVAGDTLQRHGYALCGPKVTLKNWQILFYRAHQKIIGELQIQYRWRRAKLKSVMGKRRRVRR